VSLADAAVPAEVLEAHRPPAEVPAVYDRLARIYEVWARLTESRARRRVMALARPAAGERVLEVACGTGVQLAALARANPGGETIGVDLSRAMLAQARARAGQLPGVAVREADALALPFEDASFDVVVNAYMLDLMPREDIPRALAEQRRVLRPGGRLVLSNMTKGQRPLHRVWDALYARGIDVTANCRGVLAAPVLEQLGFADVRREYVAQLAFPTEIVSARRT